MCVCVYGHVGVNECMYMGMCVCVYACVHPGVHMKLEDNLRCQCSLSVRQSALCSTYTPMVRWPVSLCVPSLLRTARVIVFGFTWDSDLGPHVFVARALPVSDSLIL